MHASNEEEHTGIRQQHLSNGCLNNERFNQSLIQCAPNIILFLSPDHILLEFNPEAERFFGRRREDVLGKNYFEEFLPDDTREAVAADIEKVLTGKSTRGFESAVVANDGQEHILSWNVDGVLDSNDKSIGVIAVGQDITGRNKAEETLQKSEEKYRTLFESANDAIFALEVSGNHLHFMECNSRVMDMFRCGREDIIGKSPVDFSPSVQPDGTLSIEKAAQLCVAAMAGEPQHFEWRHCRLDGTEFDVEVTLNRMDIAGETYLQAIVRDITERKEAEEALREQRDRAQNYLDVAGVMFMHIDTEGKVTLINKKGCDILGYREEEIVGKNWFDNFLPERNREKVKEVFFKLISGEIEPVEYYENSILTKDGEERIIAWHNTLLWEEGKIIGTLSSGEDINERNKAEEALQESENRYRSVVKNAGEGIVVSQDGILKFINPHFIDITGYSEEELKSRPFIEFVHPDDREKVMEIHYKRLKGEEVPPVYEFRANHKQGNIMWLENNGILIEWEGKPASLNFLRDITGRKKAEEALRQSEERLKILFESAPDAYYIHDLEGNFIDGNIAAEELLGYQREEAIGKSFFELGMVTEADVPKVSTAMADNIAGKPAGPIEITLNHKDGSKVMVEIRSYPVEIAGETLILGIARDISERKKAEAALAESEQRFRKFFENEPEYCYMISPEGTILEANHAVLDTLGYTMDELAGKPLMTVYAPESYQRMHQLLKQWEETGEIRDEEMFIQTKNGEKRTVLLSATQVLDEDGKLLHSVSIQRDITERKKAEEALRAERDKLQALMDGINRAGIGIDIIGADYNILFQNQTLENRFGKLSGKPCYEYYTAKQEPCDQCSVNEAIRQNASIETEQKGHDGRDYQIFTAPVPEADGSVNKAIEIILDITDRKQAEGELEKQRYYLTKAQEMGKIGTWELDVEKNRLVWTDEVYRIFELDVGTELTYEIFLNNVHPDDRQYVDQKWNAALNAEPYDIEHRLLIDGEVKWVREKADMQFRKDGSPVLAIGFTQDITERKRAEEALKESEAQLKRAQEVAHVGSWYLGFKTGELIWSDETCRIFGVPTDQPLKEADCLMFTHPDDVFYVTKSWDAALQGGPYDVEHRIIVDGTVKWVREKAEIEFDTGGKPVSAVGTVQDITERKEAEEALKTSEQRYRAIVEDQTELICRNLPDGTLTFVNEAYCRYFDKSRDELIGQKSMSLIIEEDHQKMKEHFASVVPENPVATHEHRAVMPNGEIRWHQWINRAIFDDAGKIIEFQGTGRDITKQKLAEEELKENEERFRSLSEAAFEGIAITEKGIIVDVNDAVLWMYGYTLEELKGTEVRELVAPEHRELVQEKIRSGYEGVYEHKGLCKDGSLIDLEVQGRNVEYMGRTMRLTAIRDITERKQAERRIQEYQAQLKSLASELSLAEERERRRIATGIHDNIAQKLAMAKFSLQSLQASVRDAEVSVSLEKQCELMSQVVADVRSLTFELGNPVLYQVGLEAAVESYLTERVQNEFGIECIFTSDGPPSSPDEDIKVVLFQAVRELLANIIKHANASTVEVDISNTEDKLRIVVKDDGVGFDPTKIGPYAMGQGGFGLFNIRERLEYFGGNFEIESRPKSGTRVTMTVAVKPDAVAKQ